MRAHPESRAYQGVQNSREPLGAASAHGAVAATELLLKIDRDSPCELQLSLVLLNGAKAWDGHEAPVRGSPGTVFAVFPLVADPYPCMPCLPLPTVTLPMPVHHVPNSRPGLGRPWSPCSMRPSERL